MKLIVITSLFLVHFMLRESSCTTISNRNETKIQTFTIQTNQMLPAIGRKLKTFWSWFQLQGQNQETAIGRCFGIARKLKMLMPVVIFKMGVIMTILVFLTIFSLKGLGLLVTLLVLNAGGLASKLAVAKSGAHEPEKPQNVHFHIHQNKNGNYHLGHSSPGVSSSGPGWDRSEVDSSELYNLYDKLDVNPYAYSGRKIFNFNRNYKIR